MIAWRRRLPLFFGVLSLPRLRGFKGSAGFCKEYPRKGVRQVQDFSFYNVDKFFDGQPYYPPLPPM